LLPLGDNPATKPSLNTFYDSSRDGVARRGAESHSTHPEESMSNRAKLALGLVLLADLPALAVSTKFSTSIP
jgi:hypothetical protein